MKSKVFQKITAWIQAQQEARAERRHRRALIQEDRRRKREIEQLCWELSRKPLKFSTESPKISSLKYNISIEPPKISKSAREQIGLGRKFELITNERKRTQDGEVVSLTLHWKSPKKRRYSISFDIAEPAQDLLGVYLGGAQPLPLKQRPAVGIIPRTEPWPIPKEMKELLELEASPEARAERERLAKLIFEDVDELMRRNAERLHYFCPGIKLPNGSE